MSLIDDELWFCWQQVRCFFTKPDTLISLGRKRNTCTHTHTYTHACSLLPYLPTNSLRRNSCFSSRKAVTVNTLLPSPPQVPKIFQSLTPLFSHHFFIAENQLKAFATCRMILYKKETCESRRDIG